MMYMDLDTNSLEMLSSAGDVAYDVISTGDVISSNDVITYADKLSDEIIEEVSEIIKQS